MTDNAPPSADLDVLARDYLDAWQRHLAEIARQAELPAVIGRLYAHTDSTVFAHDTDAWKAVWRGIVDPAGDTGGIDDPRKGGADHGR